MQRAGVMAIMAAALACASAVARADAAVEHVSVIAGRGSRVDTLGIGMGTPAWRRWSLRASSLALYGTAGVTLWHGRDAHPRVRWLADLSAYPVLRLDLAPASSVSPYVEGAVGVHLLSHTRINERRTLSTAFQFGELLGAGIVFGARRQYDVGVLLQHVSNGSIKVPNDGLTTVNLVFRYAFTPP